MLIRFLGGMVLLVASMQACADSVLFGGVALGESNAVGYLGINLPVGKGHVLADGWQQSVSVELVSFDYDSNGQTIDGRTTGLKYTLGHEFALEPGYLRLSLGGRFNDTRLSPDDPGNRNNGSQVRGLVELQWRSQEESRWRTQAYAEYLIGARRSNVSLFLGRRFGNGLAIGPRFSTSSDPSYGVHGVALTLSGLKWGSADVSVFIGAQHNESGDTGPSIGLDWSLYRF